jgi:hypothetical protein
MKPEHSHKAHYQETPEVVVGTYQHPIYSPRGQLEGLLLEVDGKAAQIVLDPHEQADAFTGLHIGQELKLEATPAGPSDKGEAAHPVFKLMSLTAIDGKKTSVAKVPAEFKGKVERLNFAKHGEANGVVLDSGDFIHLKPQGFHKAKLKVGDTVAASGAAKPKMDGGFVVEATEINGQPVEAKKK